MRVAAMKKTSVLLSFLFVPAVLSAQNSDVILQGFYWNSNPGDITTNQGFGWIGCKRSLSCTAWRQRVCRNQKVGINKVNG